MKTIAIIGAGGHTRSSINLLKQSFNKYPFFIYDDSFISNKEEFIHDIKLIGKIKDIPNNSLVFLSAGDNKQRASFFNQFKQALIKENLIHKSSIIENNTQFGLSNQIFANSYINSYVEIGDNNIINTSSILEHEVTIGSHNHISVNTTLCGRVKIGNNCMIGAGTTVINNISICDDVIIGAGSVVAKDITTSGTYVGVPARKIK